MQHAPKQLHMYSTADTIIIIIMMQLYDTAMLSLLPDHQLDPLGHHAVMCKGGSDVVLRHNNLRDVLAQSCHRARLDGQLEVGHGYGAESSFSRPADILVPNWMIGKPAAFDITVVSLLNSSSWKG